MHSPSLGRWLQEDPIHFAGGDTNLYCTVGNNPVVYTDPLGLQKGVLGNVEAGWIALTRIGLDPDEIRRIALDWKDESIAWGKEIAKKYKHCAPADLIENALRHSYWQMLISARYGTEAAKAAGDAHEAGVPIDLDHLIDEYHNAQARRWSMIWHRMFTREVDTAFDAYKKKHRLMFALNGPLADDLWYIEVRERTWKLVEGNFKKRIKDGLERMLKECCQQRCLAGVVGPALAGQCPFILDWDDPRIRANPKWFPEIRRHSGVTSADS